MPDQPIARVIDLIAELEEVSPTVPVEVWIKGPDQITYSRHLVSHVLQMTPSLLMALGEPDLRDATSSSPGPLPTVVIVYPVQ